MTIYRNSFGNETVPATQSSYAAYNAKNNMALYWPEDVATTNNQTDGLVADIMDFTATGAYTITLPMGDVVSTGRAFLFRNKSAFSLSVVDAVSSPVATVLAGEVKYIYLSNNSSVGIWEVFTFGTGTSSADASALAGSGLTVSGSQLAQEAETATYATSHTLISTDRAKTIVFTNSGSDTCTFPAAASTDIGNGWFVNVSNQGTGTITLDMDGAETIDGATTKPLAPGESCTVVCTGGSSWATVGYGRSTAFQFTKLVLDVNTGPASYTLTSAQASNKLINIMSVGNIGASKTVIVPSVVGIYYVESTFTNGGGGHTVTIKTAAGTGIGCLPNENSILYCDGVNVVKAQTSSLPLSALSGGAAGQVVYQNGGSSTAFTATGNANEVLISNGAAAPSWSNLSILTNTGAAKTPPVDADEFPIYDSAATTTATKLTWLKLKEAIWNALPAAITAATTKATPVDADALPLYDSAAPTVQTKLTWANLKTTFKATANTWTAPQRGTQTVADTGAFDLSLTNNFKCTPAGGITLSFTNLSAGQSGNILLINGSNYAIADGSVYVPSGLMTIISTTGTYLLGYYTDGTNVYLAGTGALTT